MKRPCLVLRYIIFYGSFSECTVTEEIRTAGSQSKIFFGFDFDFDFDFTSSQLRESNPGRLGEKRESFLCAMQSPEVHLYQKAVSSFPADTAVFKITLFCALSKEHDLN